MAIRTEKLTDRVLDGRYKLINVVGSGGMAVVYGAYDLKYHRTVAVKVLKSETEGEKNGTDSRESAAKRFETEASAMELLSHPNIVGVYETATDESRPIRYFVMEYIEANTLKSMISKYGALPPRDVLLLTEQILLALDHIHKKGILHCDVKPQNIMLLDNGGIKLADFGIARFINGEENRESDIAVGTVYYISPEQASGKPLDGRSDLYSLGVMMYEMVTGTLPFNDDEPSKVTKMQIEKQPRRPRAINPNIPKGLEQIILHAMEKHAFMRYESAAQMLSAVRALLKDQDMVFDYGNELPDPRRTQSEVTDPGPGVSGKVFALFGAAVAFVIALAVTLIMTLSMPRGTEVTMPDLVGDVWYGEAEAGLGGKLCEVEIEYVVDPSRPQNTVISQSVDAGTKKNASADDPLKVTLKVSRTDNSLTFGDYVLPDAQGAKRALENLGYTVIIEQVNAPGVPVGYVESTYPAAGTQVPIGATVKLYVSK